MWVRTWIFTKKIDDKQTWGGGLSNLLRHNKDGAIKQGVPQMCAEDSHSPLHSLLKTVRQFVNPPSPRPLHSSVGFVCWWGRGQSYGSEWLPQTAALPRLTMLLHNKGTPAPMDADVLCSLTDVSIFMFSFICPPSVWFSERMGAGAGLGVRPRHMALSEGEIYVCFKGRGGEVYIAVTCVHFELSGCFVLYLLSWGFTDLSVDTSQRFPPHTHTQLLLGLCCRQTQMNSVWRV